MTSGRYKTRRIVTVLAALAAVAGYIIVNPASYETETVPKTTETAEISPPVLGVTETSAGAGANAGATTETSAGTTAVDAASDQLATAVLATLEIKGRAPKTGYARTEFYSTWPTVDGCSLRQRIIKREVGDAAVLDGCDVVAGTFVEPYTGKTFTATKKSDFSTGIQIDHVVALSDAWQKGAQYKTAEERYAMATDPLNLLAVDSSANQQKSDGDAATWLPSNKAFRCQYVARQVSVKSKYALWVTPAEHDAIAAILETCPNEPAVGI